MKLAILVAALSGCAQHPVPADEWRDRAARDVLAMHDVLRDNSPAMVVPEDSAPFRAWLDAGLAAARAKLPRVSDERGYGFLLKGYAGGFHDSHVQVWSRSDSGDLRKPTAWPGFAVGLRSGAYVVVARSSAAAEAPAVGARLLGCDGQDAEAMARARDGYDGNVSLESGRFFAARFLLADRGNPFLPRPASCRFDENGSVRDVALRWRPAGPEAEQGLKTAIGRRPRALSVEPAGGDVWWISVPSLEDGLDWPGFFKKIEAARVALRSARLVVVDVRGNGGGDSDYAYQLARLLWGEALVASRQPDLGPAVWRVSRLNYDYFKGLIDRLAASPGFSPQDAAQARAVLGRFQAALSAGRGTMAVGGPSSVRSAAEPPNPMHGRVVVLTDHDCNSACLDLMDLYTAMPEVAQAGAATDADTIFMELTMVDSLPSGCSGFAFGHKAWVRRPRHSNEPYIPPPSLTWRGAPDDDAGERAWLLSSKW